MAGAFGDADVGRARRAKRFERRVHQLGIGIDYGVGVELDQVGLQHHPLAADVQGMLGDDAPD